MRVSTTKTWFRYFLSGALLSILLGFGGYLLDQKGFFNLNDLEIQFVESQQANHFPALLEWKDALQTKYSNLKGRSLFDLPLQQMSKEMMDEKWLRDLQITRRFPDKLKIQIAPKQWQALVFDSRAQKFFGLSETCELLPELEIKNSIDLPIIDSVLTSNSDYQIMLCDLLSQLKEEGVLGRQNISEIFWKEDGLAIRLSNSDPILLLGQADYSLKIKRVEKVLNYLEEKNLTASVISAFYQKKVVVKLRKAR